MDIINNYMSAIGDVLATQSAEECRRNVFETIQGLVEMFPDQRERILCQFDELCKMCKKDFFKELQF